MNKHSMVKLGNIVNIKTGKLDANASNENGIYPFFTCSKEPLKINSYSYDCECVLVAGNGDLNVKYYNGKFDAYQRTYIIKSKDKNILYVPYLYYFLDSYVDILREQSIGGVIKYIKLGNLTGAKIPILPIEEQRHIADVLDKVTAQIDNCKKILQTWDLLVKSKFVQMFGDPVSNPMGWEKNKLSNECEIITGNTPSRKIKEYYGNYIEWIKSDNINTSLSFLTTATEYLSQKGLKVARYVEKGSILMTCIAGSINCIGNVAITDRTVSFNQQINAIVPNKNNSWFMYYQFILSKKYIQSCINMSLKGILTKNQLSNLEFIFPPIELQNQFAEFVENVEKQKTTTQNTLNQLETLKNALMQEYFS